MQKTLFLILFLAAIFCLSAAPARADSEREYRPGETAEVKNIAVSLFSFRPHKEHNRFMNKEGMKYYTVELQLLNGRREPYEYNAYQFTVLDENDEEYQWCISSVEPKFEGQTLEPGMQGRGFLVFGLPAGKKPTKLIFDPGWISDETVTFNLTYNKISEDE